MTDGILSPSDLQGLLEAPRGLPTPAVSVGGTVGAGGVAPAPTGQYRFFKPLEDAARALADQARTLRTGERIYTGLDGFDQAMRGIGPRELMVVQGFSHSGKTLFATQMALHNSSARIAWFTPDEDRVLVLSKLVSLVHGVSAEDLERRIADGDAGAEQLVVDTATKAFPNLAVFDDVSDIDRMSKALHEARDWWGAKEQLVVFDYAGLLSGVGDGEASSVVANITALKAWGKAEAFPLVVMHQSSRSKGRDGGEVTIDSGSHGGEQQATFVVGVRRKRDEARARLRELRQKRPTPAIAEQIAEAEYDLRVHENSITFNLVKNKRPPSRLVEDTDYSLDARTGRVSPFVLGTKQNDHMTTADEDDDEYRWSF